MKWRADFHIHSCLSPCGALEMAPAAIARSACAAGLNAIALTDHNCARNTPAFAEACRRRGLAALFGVEATTSEEIHVLCLFDRVATAVEFGDVLYTRLPPVVNQPEKMGDQVVVDIDEHILEQIPRFLGTATDCSLTDLAGEVAAAGGLLIPSHIDRNSYSLISQLGMIPAMTWDALEVTPACPPSLLAAAEKRSPALIHASDAHFLADIGRRFIEFECDLFDVSAIRRVLRTARRVAPSRQGLY